MEVNRVVRGRSIFPAIVPILCTDLRKQGFSAERTSRLCDPVTRFAVIPRGSQHVGSKCNSVTQLADGSISAGGIKRTERNYPKLAFYFGRHEYPRRHQNDAGHEAYTHRMHLRTSPIRIHTGTHIHLLTSRPVHPATWLRSGPSSSSYAFPSVLTSSICRRTPRSYPLSPQCPRR